MTAEGKHQAMLELLDQFVELLRSTVDSPWLWLIVLLITGLDALIPFSPSETTVVTVAVLVSPQPELLALLIVIATAGALFGDCASHFVGRTAGPGVIERLERGEKSRERAQWARAKVTKHAKTLILVARYIPGGRFATGIATGGVRYPWRTFVTYDAMGAGVWATYSTAIGWFGGAYFADNPGLALLLAFAIALTTVALIELARRVWHRRETERERLGLATQDPT